MAFNILIVSIVLFFNWSLDARYYYYIYGLFEINKSYLLGLIVQIKNLYLGGIAI